jgi:hypothetical protein
LELLEDRNSATAEAAHCIHFLKNICRISFWTLRERQADPLVTVEATPCPAKFGAFIARVNELAGQDQVSEREDCSFDRWHPLMSLKAAI